MQTQNAGLIDLLIRKMSYLSQKQAVHAENIANISTPGFKARELTPFTFGDAMKQAQTGMKVTDPRHIVPPSMAGIHGSTVRVKNYDVAPDGSANDIERESMQVAQTSGEYQLATGLYKKIQGLFRIALKGSST